MVQEATPARRNTAYGLTLAGLIGMAIFGWSHIAPAGAQDDPNNQGPRQGGGGRGGFGGGMGGGPMMMGGGAAITANGDYVYILRGNTVYQMRASNLSLIGQKNLPAPIGGAGFGGGGGFGGPDPAQGRPGPGAGGFGGGGGRGGNP